MRNSIGLLHCYHEFIDSGVVKALSDKVPFDVIGITVPYICLPGKTSSLGLMLNVLTSDDVDFISGISEPFDSESLVQATKDLCESISAKLEGEKKPPMLMAFGPFMHILRIDADDYVTCISRFFPEVPVFGAFSFSGEVDFSKCYVLYNGEGYGNAAGLVAITGNVNPSFLTMAVPEENIIGGLGTVTKSAGNIINEINGMPVEDYAMSIGLVDKEGDGNKVYTAPMIATLEDGSTIVRVCIGGDGQGGWISGGHVPEGAKIGFTILELEDIVSTGNEIAKKALDASDGRSFIIYSCMARLEYLGTSQRELEAKAICDALGDSGAFCLAYVGGEIFPEKLPGGNFANNLQNYSLVICML
jgi:hypothetical protein